MGTRIKYSEPPEYVRPKLDDLDIATVDYTDITGVPDLVRDTFPPSESDDESPQEKAGKGYSWGAWSIAMDFSDMSKVTEGMEKFLEVVDTTTKVVVALLKLIRIFSSDFKSIGRILKVLLKVIVKQVKQIIDSFASSGVYVSLIFPDFDPHRPKFTLPVNGGYKEFVQRVNATCLNSRDEDAPKFGEKDTVGGFILAMIGGSNDPSFLADLITNFQILSKLFRFQNPMPAPAKNIRAVPGFYKDPEPKNKGKLKMGVKITWEHPGTPISGFVLRRSFYADGLKVTVKTPPGSKKTVEVVRMYRDENFDKERKHFPVVIGRPKYSFIDFDVEEGELYFYKVFTEVGYDFYDKNPVFQRIESPTASKKVFAIPHKRIPLSELVKESVYDEDGNRVDPKDMEADWQSYTLRTLLGPQVDKLLDLMDKISDKLGGMVSTSGDAMTEYLTFIEKKIKFYLNIINQIADIIERLAQLRLSGTFMVLTISPEVGGMQGFVDKFNSAVLTDDVGGLQVGTPDKKPPSIASLNDQGIMAGLMFVYGFPIPDGEYFQNLAAEEQAAELQASLDKSQKALKVFLDLLGLGG